MNKAFDIKNSKGQCIIADARFEDECMAIKYYGGKIIRVDRRVNNDNHESEQIKISQDDYVIDNTGTLVGLFYKVLRFVTDYMFSYHHYQSYLTQYSISSISYLYFL